MAGHQLQHTHSKKPNSRAEGHVPQREGDGEGEATVCQHPLQGQEGGKGQSDRLSVSRNDRKKRFGGRREVQENGRSVTEHTAG